MDGTARTVFVVDGCWDSRLRLSHELTSAGYRVRSFQSAEHFLAAQDAKTPGSAMRACWLGLSAPIGFPHRPR
jgi:FixJ family two-component response regulator